MTIDLTAAIAIAVDLAQQAGVDARVVRAESRSGRVVVELPHHIVWIAGDDGSARRLAVERRVLAALAGRLPVEIPRSVAHAARACLRTKVVGRSGLDQHRRAMTDATVAADYAVELAGLFAAVHGALSTAELARLVDAGLPRVARLDLDDVVRAARDLDGARRDRALDLVEVHRAQAVAPGDRAFLHGDLGSHNLVVDDAGRITGLFDFEESCEGDRHHEFRWMPSYGPAFVRRALDVYGECTGASVDIRRVRRLHALVALEQLGWGLREPAEHVRTGRTLDETRAWAARAIDEAGAADGHDNDD